MNKTIPDRAQQRGENWLCSIRITNPYLTPLIWKNNILLHVTWTNSEETDFPTLAYFSLKCWLIFLFTPAPGDQENLSPREGFWAAQLSHRLPSHREDGATQHAQLGFSLTLPFCFPSLSAGYFTRLREIPEKGPASQWAAISCEVDVCTSTVRWRFPGAPGSRCMQRATARAQRLQCTPGTSLLSVLQLLAGIHQPLNSCSFQRLVNCTAASRHSVFQDQPCRNVWQKDRSHFRAIYVTQAPKFGFKNDFRV